MEATTLVQLLLKHKRQEFGIPVMLPSITEKLHHFMQWAFTGSPVEARQFWFVIGNADEILEQIPKEQRGRILPLPPSKLNMIFQRGPYDSLLIPNHGFYYSDPNLLLSSFWKQRGSYEACNEFESTEFTLWFWKSIHKPLKLFGMDHHHAVLWDAKQILRVLGVQLDFVWLCDGRPAVNEAMPCQIPSFLNSLDIYKPDPDQVLSEETKRFILEENYDGVITSHSLVTCYRLETLGLPMIHINSTRFGNEWIHQPEKHTKLVKKLQHLFQTNRLQLVHNNHGDAHYFHQYFPKLSPHQEVWIPSLCESLLRLRTKVPAVPKLLLWDPRQCLLQPNVSPFMKNIFVKLKETFQEKFESQAVLIAQAKTFLAEGFLDSFTAVVHIPYNVSTMSMFQHVRANIPIWIPSKKLLAKLLADEKEPNELSWTVFVKGSEIHGSTMDQARNPDVIERWLDTADFYNPDILPLALQFDSIEELLKKAFTTDYQSLIDKAQEKQQQSRENIVFAWEQVIQQLRSGLNK